MNKIVAATPKGFRDFLPEDTLKRQFVLGKIIQVFKRFGFDPLETPTLEYAQTLKGKYGEDERLIYEFVTKGGDEVALRYDQTVPLARVIAQYPQLPKPFKRYQVQTAFRGENTQRGRYREFLQCDADIIGSPSPLADAEILALATEIYKSLGLEIIIKINDRQLLVGVEPKYLAAIDKLNKIGEPGVLKELQEKGLSEADAKSLFDRINTLTINQNLDQIIKLYKDLGYDAQTLQFDPTLVRGLDYYTGLILEVVIKAEPNSSSLLGGGRWDNMIGKFTGTDMPAIGFAIGFDRTIEAMEAANLIPKLSTSTKVLVTVFSPELLNKTLEINSRLRSNNINTEVWLDANAKLDKQFKYADQKGIPYVIIVGPDEVSKNTVTIKNFQTKQQETTSLAQIINKLSLPEDEA